MKIIKNLVTFSLLYLVSLHGCLGEDYSMMGCKWNIPDAYAQVDEGFWSKGDAFILFRNELLDLSVIDAGLVNSVISYTPVLSVSEGNYELVVYEGRVGKRASVVPFWITINHRNEKGSFYLHRVEASDLSSFIRFCMPHNSNGISK